MMQLPEIICLPISVVLLQHYLKVQPNPIANVLSVYKTIVLIRLLHRQYRQTKHYYIRRWGNLMQTK